MRDEKKEVSAQISVLARRFERAQIETNQLLKAAKASALVDEKRNPKTKEEGKSVLFRIVQSKLEYIQDSLADLASKIGTYSDKKGDASMPVKIDEEKFAAFQTSVETELEAFTNEIENKLSECKEEYFDDLSKFYAGFGAEYEVVFELQNNKHKISVAKRESQELLDELLSNPTDNPEDYVDSTQEVSSQIFTYTSEINYIDTQLKAIAPKIDHDKPFPVAINVSLQPTAFSECIRLLTNKSDSETLQFINESTMNMIKLSRDDNVDILRNLENDRGLPLTKAEEEQLQKTQVLPDPDENTVPHKLQEFQARKELY